jgi:uncharacterized membrane protein YidH (DUF202 family)
MTNLGPRNRHDDGLQAERTALAWTRTSFGVVANGALLMLRAFHGYNGSIRLIAVGLAVTIALSTHLIGIRRQRMLGRRPLPQSITPRSDVRLLGVAVLVLILASALALPV